MRTEYGYARTVCGCPDCIAACATMPGFLIPADLERLLPTGGREEYLLAHFLASEGGKALSFKDGIINVRTIVPAQKGACVFLRDDRCTVWENAPFGCAFFRVCRDEMKDDLLLDKAFREVLRDAEAEGPYFQAWTLLRAHGRLALPLKMRKANLLRLIRQNERKYRRVIPNKP